MFSSETNLCISACFVFGLVIVKKYCKNLFWRWSFLCRREFETDQLQTKYCRNVINEQLDTYGYTYLHTLKKLNYNRLYIIIIVSRYVCVLIGIYLYGKVNPTIVLISRRNTRNFKSLLSSNCFCYFICKQSNIVREYTINIVLNRWIYIHKCVYM